MKSLGVLFCHDRPIVLRECLRTIFALNGQLDKWIICIDGGDPRILDIALGAACENHVLIFNPGIGYGNVYKTAWRLVETLDPKYVAFIESDYILRKHGLDTAFDVLEKHPQVAGISGYSHPNNLDPAWNGPGGEHERHFKRLMGSCNLDPTKFVNSWDFNAVSGNVKLKWCWSTCGTCYLNWQMVKAIRAAFPECEQSWINRIWGSPDGPTGGMHDGVLSYGLAYWHKEYAKKMGWDSEAWLNIDPSVAQHVAGAGLNCGGVEGQMNPFCAAKSFPLDYDK